MTRRPALHHPALRRSTTRHLAGLALAVLLLEAGLLAARRARTGRGPAPRALAANLGAGLFLLLALRAEAMRRSPMRVGATLAMAGMAHLLDLRARSEREAG